MFLQADNGYAFPFILPLASLFASFRTEGKGVSSAFESSFQLPPSGLSSRSRLNSSRHRKPSCNHSFRLKNGTERIKLCDKNC